MEATHLERSSPETSLSIRTAPWPRTGEPQNARRWRGVLICGLVLNSVALPSFGSERGQPSMPVSTAAARCSQLRSSELGPSAVTAVEIAGGGQPTALSPLPADDVRDLPPFCRVLLRSSLSSDSLIHSELWLAVGGWNGRFLGTGNGGFAGRIVYRALQHGLERGYAVVNTDMGTSAREGQVAAMGRPVKWLDFGLRATHEATVAGKKLVTAFYRTPPRHSYWEGCSTGGFQGLRNAQFFPEDYDGIVAGSAGNVRAAKLIAILWSYMQPKLYPEGRIPASKLRLMHEAAVAECAGLGGGMKSDPFITDPRRCSWKPETLRCPGLEAAGCLTLPQIEMAHRYYDPIRLESTGEQIWPGQPRGTELGWARYMEAADEQDPPYADVVRTILGPDHDFSTSDWDQDVATYLRIQGPLWGDGANTDLSAFRARGGKLLMTAGWIDNSSTYDMLNYVDSLESDLREREHVTAAAAAVESRTFARMFLAPGMDHCGGGTGPNTFNSLGAVVRWVEDGVAPERLLATWKPGTHSSHNELGRPMSRPLCPYPQTAHYIGAGDPAEAESFVCRIH